MNQPSLLEVLDTVAPASGVTAATYRVGFELKSTHTFEIMPNFGRKSLKISSDAVSAAPFGALAIRMGLVEIRARYGSGA